MRLSFLRLLAIVFTVALMVPSYANALSIVQATSASTSGALDPNLGPLSQLIDQSGLSGSYISGVTDFDTFVSTTTGFNGPDLSTSLAGVLRPFPVSIDFTLSGLFDVDKVAVWNQSGNASLKSFSLFSSVLGDFTDTTALGTFTHINGGGLALIASFTTVQASAIRLIVNSNFGNTSLVRFDEVAFSASSVSPVPLPAALPLYGTGLAIMGFLGWRRRRKLI